MADDTHDGLTASANGSLHWGETAMTQSMAACESDTIDGGDGNDTIDGGANADTIYGGPRGIERQFNLPRIHFDDPVNEESGEGIRTTILLSVSFEGDAVISCRSAAGIIVEMRLSSASVRARTKIEGITGSIR